MTRIWWILIRALKSPQNLHFDMSFLVMFDLKKSRELSFMALDSDTKFEGKLTFAFKNDMRNLRNFHQSTWKSENWGFMGFFCPKLKMHEIKIYWEVMSHENEEWCKNWRGIDVSFQNWHEQFDKFWFKHSKISKICTLMGCLWPKYIMFDLKKYRGVMFDGTEYWCKIWRKTDFCFQKWHEEFGKFSPETWKSQNLDFDGILLNPK